MHAVIQHYDPGAGYVAGCMEASNVPDMPAPVTTFFEGEIIDNVHNTFFTADWDACADTDFLHWSKFVPFRQLRAEVVRNGGRCPGEPSAMPNVAGLQLPLLLLGAPSWGGRRCGTTRTASTPFLLFCYFGNGAAVPMGRLHCSSSTYCQPACLLSCYPLCPSAALAGLASHPYVYMVRGRDEHTAGLPTVCSKCVEPTDVPVSAVVLPCTAAALEGAVLCAGQ